jgi:Protein of unknown function (DUF5818)
MSKKLSLLLVPLLFFVSSPRALQAQQNASENRTVTGCLRQGIEPGGYYLDSHDGKMWELRGNVEKNDVGREVTVEGHEHQFSMSRQAELVSDEKQEADGRPYQGLEVIRMKVLSNSCH